MQQQPCTQARRREAEVTLQASSLSTTMQRPVLVMLFSSRPSNIIFHTGLCLSPAPTPSTGCMYLGAAAWTPRHS